ncbi:MAG: hypothetical protein ACREVK_12575 [Gammaproteobacteria bacterium]
MPLSFNERKQVARVLSVLISGEKLARDCARAQAELAPDRMMRRFDDDPVAYASETRHRLPHWLRGVA